MFCNAHTCIIKCIKSINNTLNGLLCPLNDIVCNTSDSNTNSYRLYATLAGNNPMSVAGEYPTEVNNTYVYSTTKVLFQEMLNPNMIALFKRNPDSLDQHLPIYFKDTSNYAHTVTIGDVNTPAYGDEVTRNYPYPALYVGNYIILEPTQQTLDDFKNGLLN